VDPGQPAAPDGRLLAARRREAHSAWAALLREIRALPGFADFFHAPAVSVLARQVSGGPVVYVTVDPTRADALILTDHGTDVPRPDRAAYALHHAIGRQRAQYPNTPGLWASHIHTGGANAP